MGRYKNMTKKDLIVDFVALHGSKGAKFTEIQQFIYEFNNPGKTFDKINNRGYYSSAFSNTIIMGRMTADYLLTGDACLVKLGKLYFAKRDGKILHEPQKQKVVWED